MAKLFQSQPGTVQVVDLGEGGAPGVLSISGKDGRLSKQDGVVITNIGIDQDVNIQFVPSLQKVIYVYSFGDRMGRCTVNGLAFDKTCDRKNIGYVGTNSLLDYYDKNRAISEDRVMKISIGSYSFQSYLISMRLATAAPEFKTMSFSLNMTMVSKQEKE